MPLSISEAEITIEALTREVERLKGLDIVVSNTAHRLNTPLGAIVASLSILEKHMPEYSSRFIPLWQLLSSEEQALYLDLTPKVLQNTNNITTRAERHERARLEAHLQGRVPDTEVVARQLQESKLTDLTTIDKLLGLPHSTEMLEMLAYRGIIYNSFHTLQTSAELIKDYVAFLNMGRDEKISTATAKPLQLKKKLDAVLASFPPELIEGVDVQLNVNPQVIVHADAVHLRQLLRQLVGNALHALNKAGTLNIAATADPSHITITVTDDGPGIAAELQPRIFSLLVTARNQGEGSGLGLYIAKKIVESYGGEISYTSGPRHTAFMVRWPVTLR